MAGTGEPILFGAGIINRALTTAGAVLNGGKLQFYVTGTTTPADVYTSDTLGTAHANPVVADSAGLFAPIYLDSDVTYRVKLLTSADVELEDIDPVNTPLAAAIGAGQITAAMLDTGAAVANIGYTPVNKAGDTATALNITRATTPGTSHAGFLGLPVTTLDADGNLTLAMVGGMVRHTSGSGHAYTIQPVATIANVVGATYNLRNIGAGSVTVTRGSGVALRKAGSATDANVTLAQYGWATLTMEATDVWVISGSGIS